MLKTPELPAQTHLAGWALLWCCFLVNPTLSAGHGHIPTGVSRAGQICRRPEPGCMCLASPGLCCGRSPWGIQYPRLHSTFLCPGSAAKDRALFPSLSPFPLLAPDTAPPRCQVSTLLPRTFTQQQHQTPGLGGDKSPHKPCNKAQLWGNNPEITKLPAMPRAG